jgi:hypothetical protein
MKSQKLITAFLLLLPGLSWGGGGPITPPVSVSEPGLLPLLAVGGIVAVAAQYMRIKK